MSSHVSLHIYITIKHTSRIIFETTVTHPIKSLGPGGPAIVIHTRLSSVVTIAVVIEVDLSTALPQHRHNIVERAETVAISWATRVRLIDWDDSIVSITKSQYEKELSCT